MFLLAVAIGVAIATHTTRYIHKRALATAIRKRLRLLSTPNLKPDPICGFAIITLGVRLIDGNVDVCHCCP